MDEKTIYSFCSANDIDSEFLLKKIAPPKPDFDYRVMYEELLERVERLEHLLNEFISIPKPENINNAAGIAKAAVPSTELPDNSQKNNDSDVDKLCHDADKYYYGNMVLQSYKKAIPLYRKAADAGSAYAQYMLGYCCRYARGTPVDYKSAVLWFKDSAAKGNPDAQFELGKCYLEGKGVSEDKNEAVKWLILAADKGNKNAKKMLDKKIPVSS